MPILYSVVSRGPTILAKHARCAGNFPEVTEQVLSKIDPNLDDKLTYSHGDYFFHYICESRIIYMCITDKEFERSRAFLFLNEIKRRFKPPYAANAETAMPYSLNVEFSKVLSNEMKHYSDSPDVDVLAKVNSEMDELKGIMVKNIGKTCVKEGLDADAIIKNTFGIIGRTIDK